MTEQRPELTEGVDAVVARAMAKDPADRFVTCAEFAAAAEHALIPEARPRRRLLLAAVAAAVALAAGLPFAFIARGSADAEPLVPRANTILRVDPQKNEISDVIDVGSEPNATAVRDGTLWVFNQGDQTIAEVDPRTDRVRHKTFLPVLATDLGFGSGPLLAADAGGAWMIGNDLQDGQSQLVHVPRGGRGMRTYSYGLQLSAVAAARGSIWLVGRKGGIGAGAVLRVDPATGRVLGRRPLPSRMLGAEGQGLAVGGGFVWITNATGAQVYRLDFRTGKSSTARFGGFVSRPAFGFGRLWLCSWDGMHGLMVRVNPRTLHNELESNALPAEEGQFAVGFGSLWRHDVSSGTMMRFSPRGGDLEGLIPLKHRAARLDVTWISAGAGSVWVSIADG